MNTANSTKIQQMATATIALLLINEICFANVVNGEFFGCYCYSNYNLWNVCVVKMCICLWFFINFFLDIVIIYVGFVSKSAQLLNVFFYFCTLFCNDHFGGFTFVVCLYHHQMVNRLIKFTVSFFPSSLCYRYTMLIECGCDLLFSYAVLTFFLKIR